MAKKASAKTEKLTQESTLDLAGSLMETLNSKFKHNSEKAAFFLSDPSVSSDVSDWISTGCDTLDLAISNRPNGGLPSGKIVEIAGLEASGKSLLSVYALKSTQEKGGLAIYIDTEAATSKAYLQAIGVDIDKLLYMQLEALEDIFDAIEASIIRVRQLDKKVLVTIVVDSVMGATTKQEIAAEYDKDGWATSKAIILSKAMRKLTTLLSRQNVLLIFTNQLRQKLRVTFGEQWGTSGGKAIGFHSSVRLRLKSMGQIKMKVDGVDQVVGIKTRAIVQKNRLGPPLKSIDYDIYFDSGIDNYGSWLNTLQAYNVAASGNYWTIPLEYDSIKSKEMVSFVGQVVDPETGEQLDSTKRFVGGFKFRSKDFASWMEANPELRQFIYELLCDRFIMEYKINKDYGIDDITIDTDFVAEDD